MKKYHDPNTSRDAAVPAGELAPAGHPARGKANPPGRDCPRITVVPRSGGSHFVEPSMPPSPLSTLDALLVADEFNEESKNAGQS